MVKYVWCTSCRGIGTVKDDQIVAKEKCPLCEGDLVRIDSNSSAMLQNFSSVSLFPGEWGKGYEQHRNETTVQKFKGCPLPHVRVIPDTFDVFRGSCSACPLFKASMIADLPGARILADSGQRTLFEGAEKC